MAGRPKMMAKKMTDLEAKTNEMFDLISEYIPEQYELFEGPTGKDPLCDAWNTALFAVTDAMQRMNQLARMLRDKAGIDEPEPSAAVLANMAKRTEQSESVGP